MKYVSIDIETTGLDPNTHQVIELGAAIEDTEDPKPTEELPTFRALLTHKNYIISPFCVGMHRELMQEIAKEQKVLGGRWMLERDDGTIVCMAMYVEHFFEKFLKVNGIDTNQKIIVAGKNFNGFDKLHLKPLMKNLRFHHRVLDPVTLFTRPTDQEPPNLGECAKRAGVEFTGNGYHSAVADSIMVIELLRAGWQKQKDVEQARELVKHIMESGE